MIAYLLTLHFIADFVLQSREMGKNKSVNPKVLIAHLNIQAMVFIVGLLPVVGILNALAFAGFNTLIHGVIDWYIWGIYKWTVYRRINRVQDTHLLNHNSNKPDEAWRYWDDHWFYVTLGFDQLLHALTLVLLSKMLFN